MKQLKSKIKRLFSRTKATMNFDELNVISKSKSLYYELDEMNKQTFMEIANSSYKEVNPTSGISDAWLLTLLLSYDPITKYVYSHEVDRKRSRFAESVIASNTKSKEFMTAFNLWWRQSEQYGDIVTDEARIQAFKDKGVKYLQWNTNIDGRECETCRERHKKIYPIDKLPSKTHYHCRCWYSEVEK